MKTILEDVPNKHRLLFKPGNDRILMFDDAEQW